VRSRILSEVHKQQQATAPSTSVTIKLYCKLQAGGAKKKKTTTNNQAKQGEKNTQQNQTITVKAAKRTFK